MTSAGSEHTTHWNGPPSSSTLSFFSPALFLPFLGSEQFLQGYFCLWPSAQKQPSCPALHYSDHLMMNIDVSSTKKQPSSPTAKGCQREPSKEASIPFLPSSGGHKWSEHLFPHQRAPLSEEAAKTEALGTRVS